MVAWLTKLRNTVPPVPVKPVTVDPWEAVLSDGLYGHNCVASARVLADILKIIPTQQTAIHSMRLATVMKKLGWERPKSGKVWIDGKQVRGFIRIIPGKIAGTNPPVE
jgi:hypothetical protein